MATVEEIARGISQVLADSYDGSTDDEGNPIKIGLKREMDMEITDPRVMDGLNKSFESDTEQMLADILKYIKKQYRKVTGDSLSCKPEGEMSIIVQSTSRVRNWVEASMCYKISGMDGIVTNANAPNGEELLDKKIKDFLGMGKKDFGAKKPQNVTRKKEKSE